MHFINIFKRKEYLAGLCLIYLNISTLILFKDYWKIKAIISFAINIFITITHLLSCIFLESEFKSNYLRILQIRLEKKISLISLIVVIILAINLGTIELSLTEYPYKKISPYSFIDLDFQLQTTRRCELYNENPEKKLFQYICLINKDNYEEVVESKEEKSYLISDMDVNCSKIEFESLINNKGVINNLVNKSNNEEIYFCDVIKQSKKYTILNEPINFNGDFKYYLIKIIFQIVLTFYYSYLNCTYFRSIRANISSKLLHLF